MVPQRPRLTEALSLAVSSRSQFHVEVTSITSIDVFLGQKLPLHFMP